MNPRSVSHCMHKQHLNDAAARLLQQERVMLSDRERFCFVTPVEKCFFLIYHIDFFPLINYEMAIKSIKSRRRTTNMIVQYLHPNSD